jgi:hypothetical protein
VGRQASIKVVDERAHTWHEERNGKEYGAREEEEEEEEEEEGG